jgi:hypothetical protein
MPFRFALAAVRAISGRLHGQKIIAPAVIADARQAVCDTCPNHVDGQCRLCNCFTVAKVWVLTEQCPDEPPRWLKVSWKTTHRRM